MAQTTNIGLYKLGAQSKLKDFPNLFNDDLDIIDSALGYGFGQSSNPTVKANIDSLNSNIGTLSNLSTTNKGSAVSAINEINAKVDAQKTVFVQLFNQNIAGTTTTAATTVLDVSSYIPEGYTLWSAEVQIQDGSYFYNLPWFDDALAQATWIERITNTTVILKNKASWSANTSVTLTLHCKKT